jgi:cytosine/adenosine deaminase-related metal-dependent hydrolase
MLLRARIVLPVSGPPIDDGAMLVVRNHVAAVGRWADLAHTHAGPAKDLGAVILLPGLVNAHCHLDYTGMTGAPEPGRFSDWIKAIVARKLLAGPADYAQAWRRGAEMLRRTGTTTVGDIEAVPELLPAAWASTPLRVASFLEMTGVKDRLDPDEIVAAAVAKISSLHSKHSFAGLSPHALYSTTPALLRRVAAASKNRRVTMHVAESIDETEMCVHRRGPLFDWVKEHRDMSDCGQRTPLQQIARSGLLGENFLAVHANYLEPADIEALARSGSSVAHCPRSHAYFGHQPFPFKALTAAGVNICLGTDSLASVKPTPSSELELNMFAEMQTFATAHPEIAPGAILQLATINGARALGLKGMVGEITTGSFADLIAIPYEGPKTGSENAAIQHTGPVTRAMISGKWTQ